MDANDLEAKKRLSDAFCLGWTLVELRGRVEVEPDNQKVRQQKALELKRQLETDEALRRGEMWGAILNQIAVLQDYYFPDSTTLKSLYDTDAMATHKPLALYPVAPSTPLPSTPAPSTPRQVEDYANLEIQPAHQLKDPTKDALSDFVLYDKVRRSINCLNLLYLTSRDTLIWTKIAEYQKHLVACICSDSEPWLADEPDEKAPALSTPAPSTSVPSTPAPSIATPSTPAPSIATPSTPVPSTPAPSTPAPSTPAPSSDDDKKAWARKRLTNYIVRLLQVWENYVRTRYNLDGLQKNDEILQVAFEAGHNIASLSWSMSAATLGQGPTTGAPLTPKALWNEWSYQFAFKEMDRIRQQVRVIGRARQKLMNGGQALAPRDAVQALDPQSPTEIAGAVMTSLKYWGRAVDVLGKIHNEQEANGATVNDKIFLDRYEKMHLALNEQSAIWKPLLMGDQDLESVGGNTLRYRVLSDVYNSLRQRSVAQLRSDTTEMIQQTIALTQSGINQFMKVFRPYLVAGIVLLAVGVSLMMAVALSPALFGSQQGAGINFISNVFSVLGGGSVTLGLIIARFLAPDIRDRIKLQASSVAGGNPVGQGLGSAGGQAANAQPAGQPLESATASGSTLLENVRNVSGGLLNEFESAIGRGMRQIDVEFHRLQYSLEITAPLIDFCVTNFDLKENAGILSRILWNDVDREELRANLDRALLGPLSVILGDGQMTAQDTNGSASVDLLGRIRRKPVANN